MAQYVNDPVPKYRQEDIPKTVRQLHGYTVGLTDQLQYLLSNLDADNVPELDSIQKRLTDTQGNVTRLDLTAEGLSLAVRDHDDRFASLDVTVDGIQTAVGTMDGALSTLTQTARGLESRVSTAEGQISTVTQTAAGLTTRVGNAEGSISSLQQTATSLTSRVSNAEGKITTVTQTANGLSSTVSDLNGKYTSLKQTVDGFDFTGMVTFQDLDDELSAYPTERDLERGRTVIDGGCIQTGVVELEYLDISNGYGSLEINRGSTGIQGTRGPCLTGPNSDVYLIVTNVGCRMTAGSTDFYVIEDRIHGDVEYDTGSDARLKHSVAYDLSQRYADFYRSLRPARFKFYNGKSDRYHTGFVAQDMKQALTDGGLTTQDLAALVQTDYNPETGEGGQYSVRYSELIALNTAMIQSLMTEVDTLKAEVRALKGET